MKLIKEFTSDVSAEFISEGEGQNKKWKFRGITLQAEVQNQNKRVYPKEVLREAIKEHQKLMDSGRCLGELNHPDTNATSVDYKNVSHKFTRVYEDGNNFITEAEVLDTPAGKIVQSLLEAGVKLGISSRGLGAVKESNGKTIVEKLKLITFGDIVSDPSAPDAFLEGVYEGVEYDIDDNGDLTRKEVKEAVDSEEAQNAKILAEASQEEKNKVTKTVLSDFFKTLFDN